MSPRSLASSTGSAFIDRAIARQVSTTHNVMHNVTSWHARQAVVIWMTLPTTERRVWHCGDHSAKGPGNLEHRNNHTIIDTNRISPIAFFPTSSKTFLLLV